MTSQDQLDLMVNSDVLQTIVDLMGVLTGAPKDAQVKATILTDPTDTKIVGTELVLAGLHGTVLMQLFPRQERLN